MELRNIFKRERNLSFDSSYWNPLFLQMNFVVNEIRKYFSSLPNDPLTIYDFGCGTKPYRKFCENKTYIGIDIDRSNTDADIFSDVENTPVEKNVADIVVSFFLLEHVENPQNVIYEKYRILKNGGELFMLVPLYWEEHEQPYDFFRFTRFGIEMMLKNSGFKDIRIKEVNTNPAIIGIQLAKFLNRGITKFMVPIVNYLFLKLELRIQRKAQLSGTNLSNVMTFSVKALK